ncbi:MAG: ATP-binding protein, partial [Actinobacteria bacterium]|nr:ATP-binding protein [Actinomycetota bacterium]
NDIRQLVTQLEEQRLLARSTKTEGVKFFVVIPAPTHDVVAETATYLSQRLKQILLSVPTITEPSVYIGSGFGQARYILMGRLPDFFDISEKIVERINADAFQDLFNIRTFTFVTAISDFLDHCEGLPLLAQQEPELTSLTELLSQPESVRFEVKGSVFSDVGRLLLGDGDLASSAKITQAILKTIVAFLNTKGGTLVVGAVEASRFSEKVVTSKISDALAVGDYVVVGVETDLAALNTDFDAWERRVRDAIDTRITPAASYRLDVVRVGTGTRTVAALSLAAAQDRWFYVRSDVRGGTAQFFVRDGNRTIELSGPEQDAFKAAGARL